ncbi:hypothetical protein G3480_08260 [Thiorhodococcus mannitoliphagus]|uniref:Uncharacterized protein n=1 Tax=Thiorhodococcus mannitoliphagus TaxID=329406 RepID=A0A6P1DRX1_9GAMM|nr:hypothetical protein [Thiorhodococcus mannitoliphagus]NEX20300.1 hypothetical protein [Thiorhodococcus mannitoliphagus]
MLTELQRPAFSDLLDRASRLYGQPPLPAGVKQLWWELLAPRFALEGLQQALERHLCDPDRGRRFPLPADVIAAAEADQAGAPSADEAWSIALASFDETQTVCATTEILEARNLAASIYNAGDVVGARMAFRAAYERLQRQRREDGTPVCWTLSLGWDPEGRSIALQQARTVRRLSHVPQAVTEGLPARSTPEARGIQAALLSTASPGAKAPPQRWLSELRAILRHTEETLDAPPSSVSASEQTWQQVSQLAVDAVSSQPSCSEASTANDAPDGSF